MIWFRGQSSASYEIVPSLFREKFVIGDNHFSVYPDLKGLALETNDEIESDYLKRIEKVKNNS